MDVVKIIDTIWNNLLEPMPEQFGDKFRTLTCGCIVWRDEEYLDLYQYLSDNGPCNEEYAHEVALAARELVENGDDPTGERLLAAVAGYTDGWDEEGGQIMAMIREAVLSASRCPRCGDEYAGFPALSRHDNRTEVCGSCGTEEALLQFHARADRERQQRAVDPVLGAVRWASPPATV